MLTLLEDLFCPVDGPFFCFLCFLWFLLVFCFFLVFFYIYFFHGFHCIHFFGCFIFLYFFQFFQLLFLGVWCLGISWELEGFLAIGTQVIGVWCGVWTKSWVICGSRVFEGLLQYVAIGGNWTFEAQTLPKGLEPN